MPEENSRALNYRGKCLICGDSTVGKSALTQVFCSDGAQYPKTYLMTTGVDLAVKNVSIPNTMDTVEMFLYDTAGKDAFDEIVQAHMSGIQMMVFVYDITDGTSFDNIVHWHQKLMSLNAGKDIPGVLIANKVDLSDQQVVRIERAEELAEKLNLKLFKCSAKEMRDIDTPFLYLATEFYTSQVNSGI